MDEVAYEGLTEGPPEHNEENNVSQNNTIKMNEYYGYNYDDFTGASKAGGYNENNPEFMSDVNSLFITIIASVILLVDSFKEEGLMSTLLPLMSSSVSSLIFIKNNYGNSKVANIIPDEQIPTLRLILLGSSVAALIFLTTSSDYAYLSTGYVAIWILFLSSFNLCSYSNAYIKSTKDEAQKFYAKQPIIFLLALLSSLSFVSSVLSCFMMPSDFGMCSSYATISMILSLVSSIGSIYILQSEYSTTTVTIASTEQFSSEEKILKQAALAFMLLWFFFVTFLTTSAPYYRREQGTVVANVFLSSWFCLLLSSYLFQDLQDKLRTTDEQIDTYG